MSGYAGCKLVQVIRLDILEGGGGSNDPARTVTYFIEAETGRAIGHFDPCADDARTIDFVFPCPTVREARAEREEAMRLLAEHKRAEIRQKLANAREGAIVTPEGETIEPDDDFGDIT